MQMGFGGLFMIIFWVLVIIGIVLLIKMVIGGTKGDLYFIRDSCKLKPAF